MSTINHTEELQAIDKKIQQLGFEVHDDALRCAQTKNIAGLIYIANMALGRPGTSSMRLGLALDLADYMLGHGVRLGYGRQA